MKRTAVLHVRRGLVPPIELMGHLLFYNYPKVAELEERVVIFFTHSGYMTGRFLSPDEVRRSVPLIRK